MAPPNGEERRENERHPQDDATYRLARALENLPDAIAGAKGNTTSAFKQSGTMWLIAICLITGNASQVAPLLGLPTPAQAAAPVLEEAKVKEAVNAAVSSAMRPLERTVDRLEGATANIITRLESLERSRENQYSRRGANPAGASVTTNPNPVTETSRAAAFEATTPETESGG